MNIGQIVTLEKVEKARGLFAQKPTEALVFKMLED